MPSVCDLVLVPFPLKLQPLDHEGAQQCLLPGVWEAKEKEHRCGDFSQVALGLPKDHHHCTHAALHP